MKCREVFSCFASSFFPFSSSDSRRIDGIDGIDGIGEVGSGGGVIFAFPFAQGAATRFNRRSNSPTRRSNDRSVASNSTDAIGVAFSLTIDSIRCFNASLRCCSVEISSKRGVTTCNRLCSN